MKKAVKIILIPVFLLLLFFLFSDKAGYFSLSESEKIKDLEIGAIFSEEERVFYPVIWVYDGDTFSIKKDGKIVMVRVLGVNTPEVEGKYKKEECFGKEASEKAKELLVGKRVYLESDNTQDKYDKYDRFLAYVFLEDGAFFNKKMIEDGYGYENTFKGREYKYQNEFKKAEKKAKEGDLGLWRECEAKK